MQTKHFIMTLFLIIIVAIGFFIFKDKLGLSVVGAFYKCPDGNTCSITPSLVCDIPSEDSKVILRTNAVSGDYDKIGRWIAWDVDNDNDLDCFSINNNPTPRCNLEIINQIQLSENLGGAKWYGNTQTIFLKKQEVDSNYCAKDDFRLLAGAGCELSMIPVEPYKSSNQEIYSGSLYSCSMNVKINDKAIDILSYISDKPTSTDGKSGKTYTLNSNDIVTFSGTGFIKYDVVETLKPITECNVGSISLNKGETYCKDLNTLIQCIDPPTINNIPKPNEIARCVNGQWQDAYNVDLSLDKNTIALGESFRITFTLKDDIYPLEEREVRVCLYSGKETVAESCDSGFAISDKPLLLELTPETIGTTKRIEITMTHPEGDYKPNPIVGLSVTEALFVSTFKTLTTQYDNSYIDVKIESTKGNTLQNIVSQEIEVNYNGEDAGRFYVKKVKESTGIYHFYYALKGDGILNFRIKVQDFSGLWTDWSEWVSVNVKEAQLLFKEVSLPSSPCSGASYTGSFKLVDNVGVVVKDASVIVLVQAPDETKATATKANVIDKGDGTYSFSYYYEKGGNYYVDVTVSKGTLQGILKDNPVNVLVCTSGDGGIDWTLYLIIGGAILGIINFIYFVFIRRK